MTSTPETQPTTAQGYYLQSKSVYPNSDFDYEAELVEFPGWEETDSGFHAPLAATVGGSEGNAVRERKGDGRWHVVDFRLPEKIEFETVGDIIYQTDYPYCKPRWPIMSKRMLDTLLAVGEFTHQVIPVTMIDIQKYYDESVGKYIAPEKRIEDFVAVQLLEHLDIFDWDRSVYTLKPHRPDRIDRIKRVVIKELDEGLPPLFRIALAGLRTSLHVSPQGRAALEAAGIKGVDFINLVYG
jgi:hypothetical protein